MTEYKKDADGHYIIAENVPFVFNSVLSTVKESKEETEEPTVEVPADNASPKN